MQKLTVFFTRFATSRPLERRAGRRELESRAGDRCDPYDEATTRAWDVVSKSGPVFM